MMEAFVKVVGLAVVALGVWSAVKQLTRRW